jgi:hypothetical protein
MNEGVKPHYKLEGTNSNFVLKFLFNALTKKNRLIESASFCIGKTLKPGHLQHGCEAPERCAD